MNDHVQDPPVKHGEARNLLDVLGDLIDLTPQQQSEKMAALNLAPHEYSQLKRWLAASPEASRIPSSTPHEVLELLGQARDIGESEKHGPALPTPRPGLEPESDMPEGPGSHVGQYELLQRVGESGIGVVFYARQVPPAEACAAVKIIRPSAATSRVVARFETHRRKLAALDHPCIARLLDGGVTESGRPFFVSEWVNGVPITDFCDAHSLSLRDRLDLFTRVCEAVQYGHERQLAHGSIKLSNVLVELDGKIPIPRITDFGTALCAGGPDAERNLFVKQGVWLAAPECLPPEQAAASRSEPDARTDTYSLGVLLYELLTGVAPLDGQELRAQVYEQLCRMIRQARVPSPSARLTSAARTLTEMGRDEATRSDGLEADRLAGSLRGEVDRIVLRCLEKKGKRRYATAAALAADVQRYLSGGPPTIFEKLRRLGRTLMRRTKS